jgi:hypothetical protein
VKPSRVFILVLGILVVGAGSWSLYRFGPLSATAALRLGCGLGVGLLFLVVLPSIWPDRPAKSALEEALRPRRRTGLDQPRSLRQVDVAVRLSVSKTGAHELHYRLRPVLRELSISRLRRHQVELDADPVAARANLGEDLWQIVRADCPAPEDPNDRGIALVTLGSVVERLESL